MKGFYFLGPGPFSKSLLNRALAVKSWFPEFSIKGGSRCRDILIMEKAIADINKWGPEKPKKLFCGQSASAFRFLALRVSRERGEFFLQAEPSLLRRPLHELASLLAQLGAEASPERSGWRIVSEGWAPQGDCIAAPSQTTSQCGSALALSGWQLKKDLWFSYQKRAGSRSYFEMTLSFLRGLGMEIKESGDEYQIPRGQKPKVFECRPERDKSCLFALGAWAAFKGRAVFTSWESLSLQPDSVFPQALQSMGASVEESEGRLSISRAARLKPLSMDLSLCPDMFPLLAVLCAGAEGASRLRGLRRQAFKESNRLEKTKELLHLSGIKTSLQRDELTVFGRAKWPGARPFVFDSSQDHRMSMAAELARQMGAPLKIHGREAADKSFPDFFSLVSDRASDSLAAGGKN